MATPAPTAREWVVVKTTLPKQPFPSLQERPEVRSARLVIRPFQTSDVVGLNELRSQPEVMQWTMQGVPDADITATEKILALKMPPHDLSNFDYAICVAETGQFIGAGGSFMRKGELGWPVFGYMFRKEAWGKGYATEFVKAFLDMWWALPREEVEVEVEKSTVPEAGETSDMRAEERLIAVTVTTNQGSQRVLDKVGMPLVKIWEEQDLHDSTAMETLYGYAAKRPLQ
ncbi:unnamed protein product [Clonostachys byssicola]|uniref:N-acetyltransferase domain-containing protein n=1 Tax=Clonostachys byssicola TaxID=160290 RepID=A0A9N9UI21_9HYPO|nr:unnamed protein product [Clonostachys byssicola]